MKKNPRKLDQDYWDNQGKKILIPRKVEFYHKIGVLCPLSQFKYSMFKNSITRGLDSYFYDKEGNRIPNDELDVYYKERLMNISSSARYARAKKLEDMEL